MHMGSFNLDQDNSRCVLVKLPVVLAEDEVQVLVDNTFCLPELAKKIDHIDARVQDLEADLVFGDGNANDWTSEMEERWPYYFEHQHHFKYRHQYHEKHSKHHFHDDKFDHHHDKGRHRFVKKVVVQGVLHKQIYYVNRDEHVKHTSEDIPFTKMVELRDHIPIIDKDEVSAHFFKPKLEVSWELIRGSRLQQTAVIMIRFKLVEDRHVFVKTCPPPVICPPGNLLRDPGIEHWVTSTTPLLWGAQNVTRVSSPDARNGSAAALGMPNPREDAALFQMVRRGVRPGLQYRFCFHARENLAPGAPEGSYTLEGRVDFLDEDGNVLATADQSWTPNQVPNGSYSNFCVNTGPAPEGTVAANVRVMLQPSPKNTSDVKIDDASFTCVQNR